jgi:hypothetical protein
MPNGTPYVELQDQQDDGSITTTELATLGPTGEVVFTASGFSVAMLRMLVERGIPDQKGRYVTPDNGVKFLEAIAGYFRGAYSWCVLKYREDEAEDSRITPATSSRLIPVGATSSDSSQLSAVS